MVEIPLEPIAVRRPARAPFGGVFRTQAFRLTALYLILFAGSVLALFVFIYWSTADFAVRQAESTVTAEIDGLREQYQQGGLPALIRVIAERSTGERGNATLYLLINPRLEPIAGNLSAWPTTEEVGEGWIVFPVELRRGQLRETHTARGAVFPIPGGFRLLVARDLVDATAFRTSIARTLSYAGLLTLALGVIGGVLISRNMLHRVEIVSATARQIMRGDLAQRIPVSANGDEFDALAGTLNAMLDQIERLMAGMRQVSDNIAHDLRTPLARLRARLEVALLDAPDAARYADVMRETIAEADALLGTFNALLSIAEAEAGARREGLAELDLSEVARSVAELYEPLAEEGGGQLIVHAEEAVKVRGDRHLLAQAAANLIDNALKYAAGRPVELATRCAGGEAMLAVADRGPGIPADKRESVFDRFVRLEASRSTPGKGLGLSLVRAVARLHGGTVRLEDNAPGLRAVLALPAAS
jgi:signal transduction histidine kinase